MLAENGVFYMIRFGRDFVESQMDRRWWSAEAVSQLS